MARSGPKSNTAIYHNKDYTSPIFALDDPYWRDFIAKNSRREDNWRTPSMLAWNHKQYGLLGEILDIEKMRSQVL